MIGLIRGDDGNFENFSCHPWAKNGLNLWCIPPPQVRVKYVMYLLQASTIPIIYFCPIRLRKSCMAKYPIISPNVDLLPITHPPSTAL